MSANVLYDMSRLALRFDRPAPNGIDRVDLAFARHFVASPLACPANVLTLLGPRTVPAAAAREVIGALERLWRETDAVDDDPGWLHARAAVLAGPRAASAAPRPAGLRRRMAASAARAVFHSRFLGREGLFPGRDPAAAVPRDAIYLNVSQFPFSLPSAWRWLERRPDVRPVFLVHDMLPVTHPELFPSSERYHHLICVGTVSRLARLVIVTGASTRDDLSAYLAAEGMRVPPIEVVPLPVEATFVRPPQIDPALAGRPYLVACGTVEPRKNYLMLLNVWRELARELGPHTPRLVIVGGRGWNDHNVRDMLERCAALGPHVSRISGLSTSGLKRLLDNSRGLLMPTFAEGFGLPVAEALAAGVPVVAADIRAFADLGGTGLARVSPIDGSGWLAAVKSLLTMPVPDAESMMARRHRQRSVVCYFEHISRSLSLV